MSADDSKVNLHSYIQFISIVLCYVAYLQYATDVLSIVRRLPED